MLKTRGTGQGGRFSGATCRAADIPGIPQTASAPGTGSLGVPVPASSTNEAAHPALGALLETFGVRVPIQLAWARDLIFCCFIAPLRDTRPSLVRPRIVLAASGASLTPTEAETDRGFDRKGPSRRGRRGAKIHA
jgi:hypothetical protein